MANESVIQYAFDAVGQGLPLIRTLFFTAIIVIYAIFVFFFYRYLAKQNIVGLNLRKYNRSNNSGFAKFLGFMLYILEYLIILPIVTFFWFGIIAILLLILAESIPVDLILIITASLIASVRITAYVSEKLSQDLAKMIPFTILALAITGELTLGSDNFFSMGALIGRIGDIPQLLVALPQYILFVIGVELVMRVIELIRKFIKYGDEIDEEMEVSD